MDTITKQLPVQEVCNTTHIHDFRELFGVDASITDDIIERQKSIFGFSLFLLHSKSVYDALKFGFLNSRNTFEQNKSILSLPQTYMFGGLFLGMFLTYMQVSWLFLPVFIGIIFISILPIFDAIKDKVEFYKKSRIFFNIDIASADFIREEFLELAPYERKKMIWESNGKGKIDLNSTSSRLYFYTISQIFIFGFIQDIGISLIDVIIFDIIIGSILFGFFEKFIFLAFAAYYTIYFYLFDKFPRFFSREDQERDLYMDIYRSGNSLIESINSLERDAILMLEGTISPTLSENFSSTIEKISDLFTLLENNAHLLEGKEKFQYFLIAMINEILVIYAQVFDTFTDKINSIESELANSDINEEQKNYLINIIKPILTNRKIQLESMKEKILEKRII